jgi:hypothetical protein
MKFLKSLLAAGAASMLAFAPMASQAALTLTLDDLSTGGVDVIVFDNGAGDAFALADVITYIGAAGTFNINVSTGLGDSATPALFGIDLNSVNTSLAAGTLRLTLTETDLNYSTAGSGLFSGLIGGTTTGSVNWTLLVDDNNVGGYGVGSVAMSGATAAAGAFSDSGASTLPVTDPFALTLVVDITHGASGGTTSFDFSGSIPEPTSLALISLALLGAGVASRRRKV